MPWHNVSEDGKIYKYQYHPHGDKNQPLRAAPSAMNTVIVPNVSLPAVCIPPPVVAYLSLIATNSSNAHRREIQFGWRWCD